MPRPIRLTIADRQAVRVAIHGARTFCMRIPPRWIPRRLGWWWNDFLHRLFEWLSEPHFETRETFATVEIQGDMLAEVVWKAVSAYRRRGIEIESVVLGPPEAHRSLHEAMALETTSIISQIRIRERGLETILGIPVRVVPGFSGVLVIPKEERVLTVPGN